MSGFAAVRGAYDAELIRRLCDAAPYRGDPRVWRDDGVALIGFEGRRGAPLFVSEGLAVAADARIDNRDALMRELGADAPAPNCTDAELIARTWRRWGADGLRRVVGDMAAAIYDRDTKTLHVVRDCVGVKPALIARSGGRVLAASEMPMLLADASLDRTPDDAWVAAFLVAGAGFARAAGYASVTRLAPGTVASSGDGATWNERAWWRWTRKPVRERDPRAYAEGLRERFDEAIRARIAGARRIGVALSGGLDSTSVAASARAVLREDQLLGAFAIGFTSPEGDERELQKAVAAKLGVGLRWATIDGGPFGGDPASTLARFGTPPVSPNWFHPDAVARACGADGVEVALDGIDGDSLLQGSPELFSDLLVTGRWRSWRREAEALRRVQGVSRRHTFKDFSIRPLVPSPALGLLRRAKGRAVVPDFVDPALARAHRLERMLTREAWRPARTFADREMGAVAPDVLPITMELLDCVWSQHGVEIAHPFLDRRVVEYCLGLPWHQKLAGGYTKVVLREAMRDRLPAAITVRPAKADLSAPFDDSVAGEQRTIVLKGLSLASSNTSRRCSREGLQRLERRFADGRSTFDAYRVAFLGHWFEWIASSGSAPADERKRIRRKAYL